MNGVIVLDKPEGITSFDALYRVKKTLTVKKAGHTGTLDPMATGVLPVFLGGASRFIPYLPGEEKRYLAELQLGRTSDTLDITGKILTEQPVSVGKQELLELLPRFEGIIQQVPPMYSALKKDGVRLYDMARKGIEVEREARTVQIHSIDLIDCMEDMHCYTIDVHCSKGTYIRTLADDIGAALGCGAVLSKLRRTLSGTFPLQQSVTLEQLEESRKKGTLEQHLVSIPAILSGYPTIEVSEKQAVRFSNGGGLDYQRLREAVPGGYVRVFDPSGNLLGLGEGQEEKKELKPVRLLLPEHREMELIP